MKMRHALLAAIAVLPCNAGQAETGTSLDLSIAATAASDPYLAGGQGTGALGGSLTAAPTLWFEDGDTALTASGALTLEYFDGYDLDEAVNLAVAGEHRVDERTRLTADLGYRSSRANARRFQLVPEPGDLEIGDFPDPPAVDPTLGALAGRTSRLEVGAGLEHRLTPISSLVVGANLGRTNVREQDGEDYRDASLSAQYSRELTETTALLLSAEGADVDYLGRRAGDGVLVTGLAGVDHRLSTTLHLAAQVGGSFTATRTTPGRTERDVGLAGEVELCDQRERGFACANLSRRAQPTARGGITTVTSAQLSYSRALGRGDEVGMTGTYGRSSQPRLAFLPGGGRRSELVNLSARYSRRLGDSLSGFVAPGYTSIKDVGSQRRENYQVMIGVSYALGRRR
jgi:hypothetical protein